MHLCDIKDATVIDIGGTTSDIALIENGSVNINHDGAVIGGWRTHVRAADIYTVGIGGDSRLRIGDHDELTFGPDKTTPVSLFLNNENVEETLIRKTDDVINGNAGATSGFTPTDLAHVIGLCNQWNGKASSVAVDAIRYRLHDDRETCIDQIEKAFLGTIKSALDDSRKIKEGIPIIAIGAPSHAWMPRMEQKYNFTIMVPEHADVANAIGASVGRIEEIIEILIREDRITGKYIGFLGIKREEFLTLEEAKKTCVSEGKRIVKERAMEANCADYELLEDVEDVYLDSYGGEESFYIETRIRIVAAGRPDCINE